MVYPASQLGSRVAGAVGVFGVLWISGCSASKIERLGWVDACAFATIQEALDLATAGATIAICDGVHDEAITITKPVTVLGASFDHTILTGGVKRAVVTIEGVRGFSTLGRMMLRPSPSSPVQTGVLISDSDAVTLVKIAVELTGLDSKNSLVSPTSLSGIEVERSRVFVNDIFVHGVGRTIQNSAAVRVRAGSQVSLVGASLVQSSGPGLLVSDSSVSIASSNFHETNRGVEVLSGRVYTRDMLIEGARNDGISLFGGELFSVNTAIHTPQRYGILAAGGLADFYQLQILEPTDGIHALLGSVLADGFSIKSARESGIYVGDAGLVALGSGAISGCRQGALLNFSAGQISLNGTTIGSTLERGVEVRDGQFIMQGGAIEDTGKEGIYATGGTLLVADTRVERAAGDGIGLAGTVSAALGNMTIRDNAGWGVTCDGGTTGLQSKVQLEACLAHFGGNLNGASHLFNGCEVLYTCTDLGLLSPQQ